MPSVRFVYFDLDDTLLNHRKAEREALAELCRQYPDIFGRVPVELVQETYYRHNVRLWHQYAMGEIGPDDLRRSRFERVIEELSLDCAEPNGLNSYYLDSYSQYWCLTDGAEEAFHAIADRIPVGVLTNGFAASQRAKLDRFPEIRDRLTALVISEEVGYMKPDRRLFDHAARLAGYDGASILYVGDSFEIDVRGAIGAGWQSAWFNGNPDVALPDRVFRFDRWEQLVEWLELDRS